MLTEKEIEEIVQAKVSRKYTRQKKACGITEVRWQNDYSEAAHAIHERMKEGVVWEGEGRIVHPGVLSGAAVSVPGIGRLLIDDRPSESRIGPHGLCVQVTVRKARDEAND